MKIWVWLLVLTLFGQQLNAGLVAGRETMHLLDIKHMNSGSAASQRGQSRVVRDTHVTTHCGTDAQQALPPQVQQSLLTSALLSSTERDAVEPCVWLNMSQCYAPNVRALYAEGLPSRAYVRVVFHVPRYSNGTRALVSEQDLLVEAAKLNSYFSDQLNVEFDFLLHYVDNDYLRTAIIDTSTFQSIQDGKCDPSQDFPASSFDGGDCDQLSQHRYQELGCARTSVGNRVCDPECNYAYFQWDGGDCCLGKLGDGLCRDPSSPKSVFQLAGNWKAQMMGGLQPYANNSAHIFVVPQFAVAQLLGIATFPWSPEALSPVGGLLVVSHYRNIKLVGDATDITIAHELGHCMGLFHTFSGVSEWACSDPCAETVSSPDRRIVGDMCSDTPPLPTWGQCSVAPQPSQDCNGDDFVGYPDQNVMSYTNCADRLTAQQYQIASCFLDSELLTWQGTWQQLLPHDVLPSGPAPSSWTCATSHYGTHDGCHCNCGAYDPDCELTRANEVEPLLYGCDHLANAQCNDQGVCVSTAVAPVSWTCPPEWFGSGDGCDCECGAVDLDCTTAPLPVSGCLEGTAGLNAFCSSTAQCAYTSEATAPTWVCPIEFYDANDGCDCNCGARDPDCDKGNSQSTKLYNCIEGYTPASSGDCYAPDVPSEWTCNPSYYAALDGCDCLCGVTDPDCEQAGAEFLMWNCPLSTSCKQGQCAAGEPVQQLVLQTDRNQVGCSLAANVSFLCAQYSQQNYNLFACDVEKFASYEFQVIGNKEYGYTFFLPELQLPVGFCSVNMQKSGSRISQVSLSCPILDITTFEQETCQFTFAAHSAASLLQASLLFSFFSLLLFFFI